MRGKEGTERLDRFAGGCGLLSAEADEDQLVNTQRIDELFFGELPEGKRIEAFQQGRLQIGGSHMTQCHKRLQQRQLVRFSSRAFFCQSAGS